MIKSSDIKTLFNILPVFGVVVLLLLSPCKVRNYIQAELDIPLTKVANKSQTTISNVNCIDTDLATNAFTLAKEKSLTQKLPVILTDVTLAFTITDFSNNHKPYYNARNQSVSAIPLYILYQHFKDYL